MEASELLAYLDGTSRGFDAYVRATCGADRLPGVDAVKRRVLGDPDNAERWIEAIEASGVLGAAQRGRVPPLDGCVRQAVEDLLLAAAEAKHARARAIALVFWRMDCGEADEQLRVWAGHALAALDDHASIADRFEESRDVARALSARAILTIDAARAFDRFAPNLARGDETASLLYHEIGSAYREARFGRRAPVRWLEDEPRWIAAAMASKRSTQPARTSARFLLDFAPDGLVRATPMPKPKPSAIAKRGRARDYVEPITLAGAAIDRVVARLEADGYVFRFPERARTRPTSDVRARIARLERIVGPIPAAVRAFWTIVGGVDLSGTHPEWAHPGRIDMPGAREPVWQTEPLVVFDVDDALADAEEWEPGDPGFLLVLFGEAASSAGYSGGAGLGAVLPGKDDPVLDAVRPRRTFLAELRRSLAWAGFPGFRTIDDRAARAMVDRWRDPSIR